MPPRVTICILACNEEAKIAHALRSARACTWCDELLVFDSGSTDNTVAIARELAHRVEHQPWVNFAVNRRRIVEAAKNDWVFILDADEEISPELARRIEQLDDAALRAHPVIAMPRRNYMFGVHARAYDPDDVDRLFHRRRVIWSDHAVHDSRQPADGSVLRLTEPLLHNRHSCEWGDYFDGPRYADRTIKSAQHLYDRGKRVGYVGLWLRPKLAFLKYFIIKGGFRDGAVGLLIAQKAAVSVQLKYARLWYLQESNEASNKASRQ